MAAAQTVAGQGAIRNSAPIRSSFLAEESIIVTGLPVPVLNADRVHVVAERMGVHAHFEWTP
jgi:hypothetical protein